MGSEGQAFLKKCREAGKEICLWTVNDPGEMRVAMSWGVKAILTDRVGAFTSLRKEVWRWSLHYRGKHAETFCASDRGRTREARIDGSFEMDLPLVALEVLFGGTCMRQQVSPIVLVSSRCFAQFDLLSHSKRTNRRL